MARIKQEREQEAARKAVEDKAREEAEKKEAMLRGNPLLASSSFAVKRRWDDDHVFRNQVRAQYGYRQCPGNGMPGLSCTHDIDMRTARAHSQRCARTQARGEGSGKKRFINDTIRNDFHRKFLNKYVK